MDAVRASMVRFIRCPLTSPLKVRSVDGVLDAADEASDCEVMSLYTYEQWHANSGAWLRMRSE